MKNPCGASWTYRQAPGRASYTASDLPNGLTCVALYSNPEGGWRLRAEGNLTTLLYGSGTAAGSLTAEELEPATKRFREVVRSVVQMPVPPATEWDLHRLDPSRTLVLPDSLTASEVVGAAWTHWNMTRDSDQVLSRHNSETVTLRLNKHRSHSVYDKRAEALHRKNACVRATGPALLRLEARVRPRVARSAELADWRPTLALTEKDMTMIARENDLLTNALTGVVGASVLMNARMLIKAGATASEAMRLTTVMLLVAEFGDGVLEDLGAPRATAKRWRKEARDLIGTLTEDDLIDDLPNAIRQASTLRAADLAQGNLA